jgi:hypothetical protein
VGLVEERHAPLESKKSVFLQQSNKVVDIHLSQTSEEGLVGLAEERHATLESTDCSLFFSFSLFNK